MRYGEDFYQGYPVLTHKAFGKGHVYYVCSGAMTSLSVP